ncbi:MAG: precorrin-6A/cobalt-precorrin-6A reductase [Clostridium fessum]
MPDLFQKKSRKRADGTGVRLERCLRAEGEQNKARDWVEVDSIQEAVSFLSSVSGVIFATTGSKELEVLCQIPDYQKRVYARVLPTSNVLKKCEKLGITGSHLIAMQGPFSTEMNTLFLRQNKSGVAIDERFRACGRISGKGGSGA